MNGYTQEKAASRRSKKHGMISGMKFRISLIIFIIHSFLLSGCEAGTQEVISTPTPIVVPTTVPSPTPEPPPRILLDSLTLRPGGDDTFTVYGIAENQSEYPLTNIRIKVILQDSLEKTVTLSTSLLLQHLAPGESSPFLTEFTNVTLPASVSAEIIDWSIGTFQRTSLELSEPEFQQDLSDETWVFFTASNPTTSRVCLQSLWSGAFDPEGNLLAVNSQSYGNHVLDAGETRPYIMQFTSMPDEVTYEVFTDSLPCNPAAQDSNIGLDAVFSYDAQGAPFLTGSIINHDQVPTWTAAVLTLTGNTRVLSIIEIAPPVPLQPGEIFTFTTNSFPSLSLKNLREQLQRGDVEINIELDPARTTAAYEDIARLAVNITSLESSGSKMILKGTLVNNQPQRVFQPSVLFKVTTTDGETITSGWVVTANQAEPDEETLFTLVLPVPEGADLRMSEHDLRAFGIIDPVSGQ